MSNELTRQKIGFLNVLILIPLDVYRIFSSFLNMSSNEFKENIHVLA